MIYQPVYNQDQVGNRNESSDSFLGEIIGGVVSGILAIVALILLILFLKQRKKQEGMTTSTSATIPVHHKAAELDSEKIPLEDSQEQKVALLAPTSAEYVNNKSAMLEVTNHGSPLKSQPMEDEDDDENSRPRFASPIWLEEIHNNKIFNKQKSLLSEDKLKDLASNSSTKKIDMEAELPLPPPPPLPEESEPLVNGNHASDEVQNNDYNEYELGPDEDLV